MVPFSFENIARSASYDASHTVPVSDAARATHDSFESHLHCAAATTSEHATRTESNARKPAEQSRSTPAEPPGKEPSQNESVRQDANQSQHRDDDVHRADDAEAILTSQTSAEPSDEEVEGEAASVSEVLAVPLADELSVPAQEVESKPLGDADADVDRVVTVKVGVAPLEDETSGVEASLASSAKAPAADKPVGPVDDPSAERSVKRVPDDGVELDTSIRHVTPTETNEEVADGEFPKAVAVAEATIPDDESPPRDNPRQRAIQRGDISPIESKQATRNAAPKPAAINVVETAADTTSEENSRQLQPHQTAESTQPTGKITAADTTATTSGTPSRFSQHLLARTEDSNARGVSITSADQSRFVDRVARAVQATGERPGTLRLRLSPPELGSLTLEVKVQGDIVSARVDAETPAARSLLLDNLPLLRERLAEYGMRVDQFDVDLADRQPGGMPDGLQQHDGQHEDRPQAKVTSQDPDEPHVITDETPTKSGDEQLNIIV